MAYRNSGRQPFSWTQHAQIGSFRRAGKDSDIRVEAGVAMTGAPIVNIREFYRDKQSGEWRPGKSGISIPHDNTEEFLSLFAAATMALKKMVEGDLVPSGNELLAELGIEIRDGDDA